MCFAEIMSLQLIFIFIWGGANGYVFKAEYEGNPVACKFLPTNMTHKEIVKQFTEEARLVCNLAHPNLVQYYGICIKEKKECKEMIF